MTILVAIGGGITVLLGGNLLWGAMLAPLNLRFLPSLPWAILPMAVYLIVYWRFIGGHIGPRETAEMRRTNLRANPLTSDQWMMAILTGLAGFAALAAFLLVMARLVTIPAAAPIAAHAPIPAPTALVLLVMASVVAGVSEEAGFRGYMQGPIERRYGVVPAILVNGIVFGLLHFPNHPGAVLWMLPYYVAVASVYGGITWAANSILPALALHVGGDVWSLTRQWATGRPEWQLSPAPPPLVWNTGVTAAFVISTAAVVVLGAATVASCRWLRRVTAAQESATLASEV